MSDPDVKPTVFLHIGTHKTGTTSFQRLMQDHSATFRAAGLDVRLERTRGKRGQVRVRGNSAGLANLVLRRALYTGLRLRHPALDLTPDARAAGLAALKADLDANPAQRRLISAEGLCFARTANELRRLRQLFDPARVTVVPVLVLRNPADWKQSWENQIRAAELSGTRPPPENAAAGQVITAKWYYDTDAIQRFWRQVGALRVIDYDREMAARGSVIPALLGAVGMAPDALEADVFSNRRKDLPSQARQAQITRIAARALFAAAWQQNRAASGAPADTRKAAFHAAQQDYLGAARHLLRFLEKNGVRLNMQATRAPDPAHRPTGKGT